MNSVQRTFTLSGIVFSNKRVVPLVFYIYFRLMSSHPNDILTYDIKLIFDFT